MDFILKRFTEILSGTLDNQAQVKEEQIAGTQIHPYAKHVTAVCDHKITNRPSGHEGVYLLEESYYQYPGKEEIELKPLLFYLRSDTIGKVLLESVQIPERFSKAEFTNDNEALEIDFNELVMRPFGVAEYTMHNGGEYFTVDHIADMGNGVSFRLTETLSDDGLVVMEMVKRDGVQLTTYDTPILYKNVEI